ncbi:MAG: right-handed parallel beta-helix repeat-containing protein, partial [Planctomycetaceae bacterium]|nr:right-handed parallel beta-helix repeat-containing protein [Planctomycetaceae bacterium]
LTVGAGQVVAAEVFSGVNLFVDGTLSAVGTAAAPIVFTSERDGAVGVNIDNSSPSEGRGNWDGVQLRAGSTNDVLAHVEFRYAGANQPAAFVTAGTASLTSVTIVESSTSGLRISDSDPVINGITFRNNLGAAVSMDLTSDPMITSVILDNNGANALVVDAGTLAGDSRWDDPEIPYRLNGDVIVPVGSTLTIAAGQIVAARVFSGDEILVDGTLSAVGTEAAPVIFTSERDGAVGVNIDNSSPSPGRGNWDGIRFRAGSQNNELTHVEVRYAGAATSAVSADDAALSVTAAEIVNSATVAVQAVNGATVTVENSFVTFNTQTGLRAESGSTITANNNTIVANRDGVQSVDAGTNVRLRNNLVTHNSVSGIESSGGGAVDAQFNDVFNLGGGAANYRGITDATGTNGNISADPLFINRAESDFRLSDGSPAIDAADGTAAPPEDKLGRPRVDEPQVTNTGTGNPDFGDLGALERNRWFSEIMAPVRSGEIVAGDSLRVFGTGNASPQPTRYLWDLGGGRTSAVEDPGIVTFPAAGLQTLTFRAVGADGVADPQPAVHQITVVAAGGALPDLSVTEITLPNGLTLGQVSQVDFTISNVGTADFPATSRVDAVYLSADEFLDSGDQLLTSVNVTQMIPAGDSRTGSLLAALPEERLGRGVNYLIVSVDDEWAVTEQHQLNNERALSTTAAIPELISGTAMDASFAESESGHYYRIEVPEGKNLTVVLDDADNKGTNELYARFGAPPTRGEFDARQSGTGADQSLIVPAATPGTWYILTFGASVGENGDYSVLATADELSVFPPIPDHHGTAADAELTIRGAGFGAGTSVELVADGGSTFSASSVSVDSFTQLTAVFAAGTVPPGVYDLKVSHDGATGVLNEAFTMVSGGSPRLETNLILPSALGYHQLGTIIVEYTNTGDVAMPAPLLMLQPTQTHSDGTTDAKAFLTLEQSNLTRGFWTSSIPAGFTNKVAFLASGEVPGVLKPGETGRVPVYWAGWQQPWDFRYPAFDFGLSALTADNTTPLNISDIRDAVSLQGIEPEAWDVIFANLSAQFGNTWGGLIREVSNNAGYLGRLGLDVRDFGRLLTFEVMQADRPGSETTLASGVDTVIQAPGIPLTFSRSFGSSISDRRRTGPLGRGWAWSDRWLLDVSEDTDGTVVISTPDGLGRRFQPDVRGGYFSESGDSAGLAKSGGVFELTESDGSRIRFNADGRMDFIEDRSDNRVTIGYTSGRITTLTHSSGQVMTIAYNAAGRITSVTDDAGHITTYTYDAGNEHLLSVRTFDGQVTTYAYDVSGTPQTMHALTSVTFPDGVVQTLEYDARGRLDAVYLGNHLNEVQYTYGDEGQVTAVTADGASTKYFLDDRGLQRKMEDGLGRSAEFIYDDGFHLIQLVDASGRQHEYTYDSRGNIVGLTEASGRSITYGRDQFGQLTTLTGPSGSVFRFAYDTDGNLTTTTFPDGSTDTASYDQTGKLTGSANRRGQNFSYTYDASGRILSRLLPDGSRVDFTYDAHGNLT